MSNILNIAQSGLLAAQAGLNTTGHNIANASTPGYSRQIVQQATMQAQNAGYGFTGSGTQVEQIKRVYNDFLGTQVVSAQNSQSAIDSYKTQISQVDNMLADATSGLTPALQDFFKGVQDLASNPASSASRQAVLSNASSLAARFQGMDGRLNEIREGVNSQITSGVAVINSYAQQIAKLNDSISTLYAYENKPPNDLLDQRDQLVLDLNKQIKATVVKQSDNTYTVTIGNGQALVVGLAAFSLAATMSDTDPQRLEVGYKAAGGTITLAENSLTGGALGGLLEFRSKSLDVVQNEMGRVAVGLAITFNDQHKLGQDQNGVLGTDFFTAATPLVAASTLNSGNTVVTSNITDAGALTASDYTLRFDGVNYNLTRLSDNKLLAGTTLVAANAAAQLDGFDLTLTAGTIPLVANDRFLIRPTAQGANLFNVAITDRANIAAAAPIVTANASANIGSGKISAGFVDKTYLPVNGGSPLIAPANVTLTYDSATSSLSGFPPTQDVTVTTNGVAVVNPAPVASIPYAAGSTISFGGINLSFTGQPANNDTFTIGQNLSGVGDSRNALALGALQAASTLDKGTATYQGAYAGLVSFVGNKTRELQVTGVAADTLLAQSKQSQQAESGVNLDEEAANLLRYQQAYQAAGKVMQIANQMFDVLMASMH